MDETDPISQDVLRRARSTSSVERYLALGIDNVLAFLSLYVVVAELPEGFDPGRDPVWAALLGFASFGGYFAYFFVFEWILAATPGKLLFGLRVLTTDGTRCGGWPILVRTATRVLEANPLLFGALPGAIVALRSAARQRWGDHLAGTVVVPRGRGR